MTNFEKYYSKIKEISSSGSKLAMHHGILRPCKNLACVSCDFRAGNEKVNCEAKILRWLCKEYKKPIKLTAKEKAFLSIVETGWIARDKNCNYIYWYDKKPKKEYDEWICWNSKTIMIPLWLNLFKFIEWEDEPYSVEEMLTWEVEE